MVVQGWLDVEFELVAEETTVALIAVYQYTEWIEQPLSDVSLVVQKERQIEWMRRKMLLFVAGFFWVCYRRKVYVEKI